VFADNPAHGTPDGVLTSHLAHAIYMELLTEFLELVTEFLMPFPCLQVSLARKLPC
jgi:hypothetical protein